VHDESEYFLVVEKAGDAGDEDDDQKNSEFFLNFLEVGEKLGDGSIYG